MTTEAPLDLDKVREKVKHYDHKFDACDAEALISEVERLRKQIAEAKDELETAKIHSSIYEMMKHQQKALDALK